MTARSTENSVADHERTLFKLNKHILSEVAKLYRPPHIVVRSSREGESSLRQSASHTRPDGESTGNGASDVQPIGLRTIGNTLGHPVALGQQKATVMVIGNVSAGKSTFINWLVQEAVQKTGMAIETSGFTFVTSGRCVSEISGESTLALRPQLQRIADTYRGFLENLSLKTCPSRNGRLQLIDLIDTPGLADGELQYPFDVEQVILEMIHFVDLFLVFFDPIGQALGSRVLSVVKQLMEVCPDKVRFCLTKVDQIRTAEERIKVMCQTTQSLTAKIRSRHGFDLIPIFVPGAADGSYLAIADTKASSSSANSNVVNRLTDLVQDIEKATDRRVQDALNTLHSDISALSRELNIALQRRRDQQQALQRSKALKRRLICTRFIIFLLALCFAVCHLRIFQRSTNHPLPPLANFINNQIHLHGGPTVNNSLDALTRTLLTLVQGRPPILITVWTVLIGSFFSTLLIPYLGSVSHNVPSDDRLPFLLECQEFLKSAKLHWKQLNRTYLNHATADTSEDESRATSTEM